MIKRIRIDTVHNIGRSLADSSMTRKKYDYEYYRDTKRIKCNLTQAEYKKLAQEARKAGLKDATYLKQVYHAYHANKPIYPKELEQNLTQVLGLLRNSANNINQIAKKTNTLKKIAFGDLLKTKKTVHELEAIVKNAFNSA